MAATAATATYATRSSLQFRDDEFANAHSDSVDRAECQRGIRTNRNNSVPANDISVVYELTDGNGDDPKRRVYGQLRVQVCSYKRIIARSDVKPRAGKVNLIDALLQLERVEYLPLPARWAGD